MKNFKIGARLASAFVILILMLILISVISINRLMHQKANTSALTDRLVPSIQSAQQLSYVAVDISRMVRNIILVEGEQAKASNKAGVEKARAETAVLLSDLEKHLVSEEGKLLLTKIRSALLDYRAFTDRVVGLALANKPKEAAEVLYGPDYKAQVAYLNVLKELVSLEASFVQKGGADAQEASDEAIKVVLLVTAIATLLGIAFAYFITKSITSPIGAAVIAVNSVAKGDLAAFIANGARDETGQMLNALRSMQENLAETVGKVRSNAAGVATASKEISQGNQDLSSRTEEQASSLEQTAASMEQLTSTVKQNAENARQANQLALSASDVARKGGAVVDDVVSTMASIDTSSKKIVEIIATIDGIAFQTNILALNAAVEAARAGEQGRGFAVVAAEVRNLAQRSAGAAKEIKGLIADSVANVGAGTKLVGDAGRTMAEIVDSVQRVTDIMGEITAASQEQTAGIEQINQAISQMDQVTQQNAALVEEAAAASGSLRDQAEELINAVSVFTIAAPTQAPSPHAPHQVIVKGKSKSPSSRIASAQDNSVAEWQTF